jgi:hypothetical protein
MSSTMLETQRVGIRKIQTPVSREQTRDQGASMQGLL